MDANLWLWVAIGAGLLAILYGAVAAASINKLPAGNARMQEIAGAIQAGAQAYLNRQYSTIAVVGVVLCVVLGLALDWATAGGFAVGAILSGVAGYVGMNVSVRANVRTAEAARQSLQAGLTMAFRSGAVTGMLVAGLALGLAAALHPTHLLLGLGCALLVGLGWIPSAVAAGAGLGLQRGLAVGALAAWLRPGLTLFRIASLRLSTRSLPLPRLLALGLGNLAGELIGNFVEFGLGHFQLLRVVAEHTVRRALDAAFQFIDARARASAGLRGLREIALVDHVLGEIHGLTRAFAIRIFIQPVEKILGQHAFAEQFLFRFLHRVRIVLTELAHTVVKLAGEERLGVFGLLGNLLGSFGELGRALFLLGESLAQRLE